MTDARLLPPIPVPDPESAGYWESLSTGVFALSRCTECHRWMQVPQEHCRWCGATTSFEEVSGRGTVFSFIVVRHQSIPSLTPPYVVGMIEFDEQPGLRLTGIIEADPDAVAIGQKVQAIIRPIGESGFSAPSFELVP